MLEKMGRDPESDACCATGDDVDLVKAIIDVLLVV